MAAANGVDYVSGSFTVPNTGTSYTLDFGKTFSNGYIFMIEATETSKTSIMNSGSSYARGYCYLGVHPTRYIGGQEYTSTIYVMRVAPLTGDLSNGVRSGTTVLTNTGITLGTVDIAASGWSNLVHGLTYNYYVYSLDV